MGFCIGGSWCRKQKCRDRCKGWFGMQPDVERQCKKACSTDQSFDKQTFLCSGKYAEQEVLMLAYGYDPCKGDDVTIGELLDPAGNNEEEAGKFDKYKGLIFIVAAIMLLVIAAMVAVKMK